MKNTGARNNITTAYIFGELSPPLMTPMFVDGAAGLALAAPALEGGLMLHLRTLSHNVLRAEAQRRGLGRARSDDPPQRIEHLSGGCLHRRGAHHPQGATPRPPSDLHAQVLPGDPISPLEHRVVSSPMAWPSHTHTSEWPLVFTWALYFLTQRRASLLTANLLSHLILISLLSMSPVPIAPEKQTPNVLVAPYYFIIRGTSVDTTAP
jgi:hypothetical protein